MVTRGPSNSASGYVPEEVKAGPQKDGGAPTVTAAPFKLAESGCNLSAYQQGNG